MKHRFLATIAAALLWLAPVAALATPPSIVMPTAGPLSMSSYSALLNTGLADLNKCFSGTSAPSSPTAYQCWVNTTSAPTSVVVNRYDGASWLATGTINATAHTWTPAGYSEGTWTPVLTFATPGNLSVAYSVQVGSYTKVGRLVTVSFDITTSTFTHTTASGNLTITGLPFTSKTLTNYFAVASSQWSGITKASYTDIVFRVGSNSSSMFAIASGSGQANSAVVPADTPTGGTMVLIGTLSYETP